MWGDKAFALVKELERSTDTMPPFDDDAIRLILEEMRVLNQFIEDAMNSTFHPETNNFLAGVKARQAALERNKRCLLAYQWNRLQKLRELRWEFGNVLPHDVKANLSEGEVVWFNNYSKCLASYMRTVGGENGLNLFQDFQPPKDLYIEVRCLVDYGKLELDSGEVIMLNKDSQHLMPRSQCEHLIRQGILKQID
ncbi:DNA replication complex GINS protein PSF1-like [Cimex lectularius]|uniref:DNA replication complex GINS protein PSF1 n=1 Tax=Cimex lectularius TaxID=79782 RepID=A0A8I6S3Y0_CIMLE|nr:DNA replication complex GINS protein PSF1-like [Cimex lectularius]